jgi:outer membrane immunogenic protein
MKRYIVLVILFAALSSPALAQAPPGKGGKQLNVGLGFSDWGVPIYVGADFGVHDDVTIGPKISYRNRTYRFGANRYDQSLIVLGFNGNYHFNKLLNLESKWNLYAGLTLGYYLWSDSDFPGARDSDVGLDLQIGGRYFFNDKFGLNLELGGGSGTGAGSFGITLKL